MLTRHAGAQKGGRRSPPLGGFQLNNIRKVRLKATGESELPPSAVNIGSPERSQPPSHANNMKKVRPEATGGEKHDFEGKSNTFIKITAKRDGSYTLA